MMEDRAKRRAYENIKPAELPFVHVQNYNEKEETTCVDTAILVKEDCLKRWIIVPLLSLLSLFAFPVVLYWKPAMRKDWLYKRPTSVQDATHIYIQGRGKSNSSVNTIT